MFDVGVVGEGEITFHLLCQAIRDGGDFRSIEAICFRTEDGIVVNPKRERVLEQDSLPDPAFDLLPSATEYWVQTVRGCPFNCHFCMNHNGRVARKRDVDRVIAQIESLIAKHGAKHIRFGDEIFTIDMERTHMLLDEMIDRGIHKKITWDCQTHVRFVDLSLTKKMKAAGCLRVDMGIETAMTKSFAFSARNDHQDDRGGIRGGSSGGASFRNAADHWASNETKESIKRTLDLAVRFNPDTPFISVMTPFRGRKSLAWRRRGRTATP